MPTSTFPSTGGAPVDGPFVTSTTDATLSAERVLTDTASVTWDFSVAGQAKATSTSGAPTDATFITQTSNSGLSAEQALASLSTGIAKVTTTTGVISTVVGVASAVIVFPGVVTLTFTDGVLTGAA
jgi:hypothetical protein